MTKEGIEQAISDMPPGAAADELIEVLKKLFSAIDEEEKIDLIMNLFGETPSDKIGSMVHRWLAECMDEGVDPTNVCQGLMEKLARSEQLRTVADPNILALFEDWLEELEEEVVSFIHKTGSLHPDDLVERLGLSRSGATFLLAKLKREGKI